MKNFVVDCSVAVAWVIEDEVDRYTESILGSLKVRQAMVPMIFVLELANVLLVAERQGRLDEKRGEWLLESVLSMPINVQAPPSTNQLVSTMRLARDNKLSVYDASYLELCLTHQLALASKDKQLKKAAKVCQVELLV